jgi:hypothetical protein
MSIVRQRRLQSDHDRLVRLVSAQGQKIAIEVVRGNPPETYIVALRGKSIAELRGTIPVFCERQRMKIEMPTEYPAVAPMVTVLGPIFHPHVWPRTNVVCLGPWNITEPLDNLVLRLYGIARFHPDQLNWKSVANQEAAQWASRNQQLFPLEDGEPRRASVTPINHWYETA